MSEKKIQSCRDTLIRQTCHELKVTISLKWNKTLKITTKTYKKAKNDHLLTCCYKYKMDLRMCCMSVIKLKRLNGYVTIFSQINLEISENLVKLTFSHGWM